MYMYSMVNLQILDPQGYILVAGGLFINEGDLVPYGIQEGGAAIGQVGGACYYHL